MPFTHSPRLAGATGRGPRAHRIAKSLRATCLAALLATPFSLGLTLPAQAAPAADTKAESYVPDVGQQGKDVIWVPTPQTMVDKMLDMAKVTPKDRLMDLGSGDGRTVITAAKRGLTAKGIEYNPDMVELSKRNAAREGVAKQATFEKADLFETDLSKADVITMFLLPTINEKLRPKILELKPGTRIVSNSFHMGDWEPDATEEVKEDCRTYCTALLWIVPAKVEGAWKVDGQTLQLTQTYQMLTGKLGNTDITDARLDGKKITFTANGTRYTGEVNGRSITGTKADGGKWSAKRA